MAGLMYIWRAIDLIQKSGTFEWLDHGKSGTFEPLIGYKGQVHSSRFQRLIFPFAVLHVQNEA